MTNDLPPDRASAHDPAPTEQLASEQPASEPPPVTGHPVVDAALAEAAAETTWAGQPASLTRALEALQTVLDNPDAPTDSGPTPS